MFEGFDGLLWDFAAPAVGQVTQVKDLIKFWKRKLCQSTVTNIKKNSKPKFLGRRLVPCEIDAELIMPSDNWTNN